MLSRNDCGSKHLPEASLRSLYLLPEKFFLDQITHSVLAVELI